MHAIYCRYIAYSVIIVMSWEIGSSTMEGLQQNNEMLSVVHPSRKKSFLRGDDVVKTKNFCH